MDTALSGLLVSSVKIKDVCWLQLILGQLAWSMNEVGQKQFVRLKVNITAHVELLGFLCWNTTSHDSDSSEEDCIWGADLFHRDFKPPNVWFISGRRSVVCSRKTLWWFGVRHSLNHVHCCISLLAERLDLAYTLEHWGLWYLIHSSHLFKSILWPNHLHLCTLRSTGCCNHSSFKISFDEILSQCDSNVTLAVSDKSHSYLPKWWYIFVQNGSFCVPGKCFLATEDAK